MVGRQFEATLIVREKHMDETEYTSYVLAYNNSLKLKRI